MDNQGTELTILATNCRHTFSKVGMASHPDQILTFDISDLSKQEFEKLHTAILNTLLRLRINRGSNKA